MTKEEAKQKISDLVERFGEQIDSYKKSDYNETLTRRDFIDPFFKALGWDIDNEQGYAEAYREVIHEDRVKVGSATKAPDYSFRLVGGKRLFFVEAKKPSIVVKDDILPAYQIRRYGWSAKLSISIITDFEEFAIYDCTKKPIPTDKASVARVKYLTFKDYLQEFDFLWDTFSKEKVLKGSFDKFVQSNLNKKGTATVDKEFLQSLDSWRTYLATSVSWNNKQLDEDEINFVVQQTIDRIIFLRIAEDRHVEPYGTLKEAIKQGDFYKNLYRQFEQADEKYNSGLFDFKKDKISKTLSVDNKVLKSIINELYYPESPYEFSVLSVEILGSAYEQFLGKVIRIDKAHRAHIEEKPEVRKAGGVYYTPQYVVEYIVKNTVGKLIEGKTPKEISKIKIVDPACGSGSFLIGAYQYLLDWHKNYYTDNGKISKGTKGNPLTPEGNLTTSEKKRILLNNIFGVDIDVNAVEVTKLSLLLKCMEGETQASIASQLRLFNERVLPTLDENIKSGNSLIDTDFYDTQLDFGEEKKIKPFNWRNGFPEIFKQGGFDIVIGNPPYFSLDIVSDEQKNYYEKRYSSFATRQSNIYFFFIAKSYDLLKEDGRISFINERYYFNSKNAEKFRRFVLSNYQVEQIVDFKNIQIFDGVNTLTVINTFKKSKSRGDINVIQFEQEVRKLDEYKILESHLYKSFEISQKNISASDWTFNDTRLTKLQAKLDKQVPLDELVKMGQGIKSGLNEVFIVDKETIKEHKLEKELLRKYIKTRDIQKYQIQYRDLYLILSLNETDINDFPNTKKYLSQFKKELEDRYQFKDGVCKWYSLSIPQNLNLLQENKEKIFTPLYSKGNKFSLDTGGKSGDYYILTDAFVLVKQKEIDFKYLLALLNSSLLNFFNLKFGKLKRDGYYEYSRNTLSRFPIKVAKTKEEIQKQNEIIKLTDKLLQSYAEISETNLQSKLEQLEGKINYYEKQIDELVYQLYELTDSDIKLVEMGN
ncbi:MAG: N-6 DNA methylase [Cytophagales bacterium]|nr:N-6 DNA methylase [Cytophagales bacterium]